MQVGGEKQSRRPPDGFPADGGKGLNTCFQATAVSGLSGHLGADCGMHT